MRYVVFAMLALVVSGCEGIPSKLNPLNNGITYKPYEGLSKNSYGLLRSTILRSCSATLPAGDPLQESLDELGRNLIGDIYTPIGGMMVYDDTLVKEDLQDQFRKTGDIGKADVVVLHRDENEISFWYDMDAVSAGEVSNAAKKFCNRKKKHEVFLGAASKCGPTIAGQTSPDKYGNRTSYNVTPTYAIAAFLCK